jgi:hypothetical protein
MAGLALGLANIRLGFKKPVCNKQTFVIIVIIFITFKLVDIAIKLFFSLSLN